MRFVQNDVRLPRLLCVRLLSGLILAGLAAPLSAGVWEKLFPHDIDVITVTDVTAAGKAVPAATPQAPVYYRIMDFGERPLGPTYAQSLSWAGEKLPPREDALRWVLAALAEQGYQLADKTHPATLVLIYSWGLSSPERDPDGIIVNRPALAFLGGNKVDLMWEQEFNGGFINPNVLLRGFQRMGVTGKVWEFANGDLFFGRVRAFTPESVEKKKPMLLWETRFACPADGLALADTLGLMIKAAAPNFGRVTEKPVNVNASQVFKGRVDLGEFKVLGEEPPPKTK